jgi:diguanylate cyclase (GGDEF)-like protein/PAS domain S-box-containing protein
MSGRKSDTTGAPDGAAPEPPALTARTLDEPARKLYDAFAGIAADLCDVPVGIVSLADDAGTWREAFVVCDEPDRTRAAGFAFRNATLAANRTAPDVEDGYAGVALVDGEGRRLGTLGVLTAEERSISPAEFNSLETLARLLVRAIESRELRAQSGPVDLVRGALALVADPIAIFRRGEPGAMPTFVYINRAFTDMFEFEPADVIGKFPAIVTGPDTGTEARAKILRARGDAPIDYGTLALYASNGKRMLVEMVTHSLDDRNRIVSYRDVTRERAAQGALSDTNSRLRSLVSANSDAILTFARDGTCIDANPAAEVVTGYARTELLGAGFRATAQAGAFPDDEPFPEAFVRGGSLEFVTTWKHRDGREITVECNAIAITVGKVTDGAYLFAKDTTERRRLSLLTRKRAERETALCAVSALPESGDGDQIAAALELVVRSLDLQYGFVSELVDGRSGIGYAIGEPIDDAASGSLSTPLSFGDRVYGEIGFAWRSTRTFDAADLDFIGLVTAIVSSALARRSQTRRLQRLAYYDVLSDLPNRANFRRRLLAETARAANRFALHFIDLDGFKSLNDRAGHAAGDLALNEAGRRLERLCRNKEDLPARLGGDEFVVIQVERPDRASARAFGERIVSELSKPYRLGETTFELSASVGVALFPADGKDAESLIGSADAALYRAKASGKQRVELASTATAHESLQ